MNVEVKLSTVNSYNYILFWRYNIFVANLPLIRKNYLHLIFIYSSVCSKWSNSIRQQLPFTILDTEKSMKHFASIKTCPYKLFWEQGIITKPPVNKLTMTKKTAKIINSLALGIPVFSGKHYLYFLDYLEMF